MITFRVHWMVLGIPFWLWSVLLLTAGALCFPIHHPGTGFALVGAGAALGLLPFGWRPKEDE